MSLTVKAFLEKDGKENGEIRRFQIPADVSSNHSYLVKKVATIFPTLTEGKFSLYWKDPDGDSILFSTDEEQMEALGFVTDSLFKIFIRTTAPPKTESEPAQLSRDPEGELHPGIVCDGCEGSVRGNRFKCMVCPDYDLCSNCEGNGMHQEHNMTKISTPVQRMWGMFPPPPPPPPHGMRGPFMHPGHPRPGEPFAPPPHFRRWMKKFMKRWHNKNVPGYQHDDKDDSPDEPEGETKEEEYLRNVGESVTAMLDPMGIDVHFDIEHGGKRHCHGPRGRGKCRGSRSFGCRGNSWGPDVSMPEESPKRKEAKKMEKKEKKEKKRERKEAKKARKAGGVVQMDVENAEQSQAEAESSTEELTKETEKIVLDDAEDDIDEVMIVKVTQKEPKEAERMDVQKPKDQSKTNNGEEAETWTLLSVAPPTTVAPPASTGIAPPASTAFSAPMSQAPPAYSAVPVQAPPTNTQAPPPRMNHSVQFQMPPQVVYPPSNPKVAEALQQMESMGFNNEGGWLTQLLEAKNGDIIQVLDAIKPQPGRNNRTADGGYMA